VHIRSQTNPFVLACGESVNHRPHARSFSGKILRIANGQFFDVAFDVDGSVGSNLTVAKHGLKPVPTAVTVR
jgi:hypothetical protein